MINETCNESKWEREREEVDWNFKMVVFLEGPKKCNISRKESQERLSLQLVIRVKERERERREGEAVKFVVPINRKGGVYEKKNYNEERKVKKK